MLKQRSASRNLQNVLLCSLMSQRNELGMLIMFEYFSGWRRKAGVVTLILSCTLLAGWVRSLKKRDFLEVDSATTTYRLASGLAELRLIRAIPNAGRGLAWTNQDITIEDSKWGRWEGYEMQWEWDFAPFNIGVGTIGGVEAMVVAFPYWSIILPITVLSTWCLVSKRCQPAKIKPIQELSSAS